MGLFAKLREGVRRGYLASRVTAVNRRIEARVAAARLADARAELEARSPGATEPSDEGPISYGDLPRPAPRGAPVSPVHPSVMSRDDAEVPPGLRVAAAWAWRMLLLIAAIAVALWLIGRVRTVLIPLSIAMLLSALLAPAVGSLRRRLRFPRSLATATVLIAGIATVSGTLTLVINEFINGVPKLSAKAVKGLDKIKESLHEGPVHLSTNQINQALDTAGEWLQNNSETITSSALSTAAATVEFLASMFLVLFATFFFLRDGRKIWRFVVRLFPGAAREPLGTAGEAAWHTLVAYVRATVLVAFIDALGIGLVLLGFDVELAVPLAALVFLSSFIPIVGATVSGAVAVLVALVDRGLIVALIILGSVIAVQQIEGHVLQPLIMGRAVAIHPLAVIVAIATGVMLAGIVGALFAVPIVAVLNTGVRHLANRRRTETLVTQATAPPEQGLPAS